MEFTENKTEGSRIGIDYEVSDEQIKEHLNRTTEEILDMIFSTAEFVLSLQSKDARRWMERIKNGEDDYYVKNNL